jgi:inward rectifier potassium channel
VPEAKERTPAAAESRPPAGAGAQIPRRKLHRQHQPTRRLVLSNRTIVTHGLERRIWLDLYHYFMTVSWPNLFLTFAGFFFSFNIVFALLYYLVPGCIANRNPEGFWGDFFFSVETLATVGYGDMHPQILYGHIVAGVEIFVGMMSIALMTGAMFARFSRPQARFLFADVAVVRPIDGKTTLMLRAANARQNIIMEASAQLRVVRDAVTLEGFKIRRIHDLALIRSQHPIFLLGWNLMHVIDETSPLNGDNSRTLARDNAIFLLTLSGTDETTGQVLMARHEYDSQDIRWNHAFRDTLRVGDDGLPHFDYTHFHVTDPLAPEDPAP